MTTKCRECGKRNTAKLFTELHGADADGNRGVLCTYYECLYCGATGDADDFADDEY